MNRTMKKLTQAMAIVPEAIDHLPSENGPGLNVFRPDVTRKTIGVMYDIYSAMTDALSPDVSRNPGLRYLEDDVPSERRERGRREAHEGKDCARAHDEPHRVHRRACTRMDLLPPPRPRECVVPREREHDARRVDALRRASHPSRKDDAAPDGQHALLSEHVEIDLAHGHREVCSDDVGDGGGGE